MNRTTLRLATLLAAAAAVTATVGVAPAVSADPARDTPAAVTATVPATATTTASIKGSARMAFPAPGHDIRITVDARSTFPSAGHTLPSESSGTFRIYHKVDPLNGERPKVYWGDFKVDCMTSGGPNATVTGTLVRTSPDHPWQKELDPNVRMGVSFYVAGKGGEPSRIGLSGARKGEQLTKCMAPAPDAAVIAGGYDLKAKGPLK
ncbi:hypothetical protein [Streptomyces sp. NPDC053048]|uniref:hypothetical protein n=1 Tax=Streptomyces sp. NPDC053048 TaxID=3365694 RepID=UPI0037D314BF